MKPQLRRNSTSVDQIPVLWVEPPEAIRNGQLVLFLPNFSGTKDQFAPMIEELAGAGFVALSFDPWQHGERGTESRDEMVARVQPLVARLPRLADQLK